MLYYVFVFRSKVNNHFFYSQLQHYFITKLYGIKHIKKVFNYIKIFLDLVINEFHCNERYKEIY